ncbi:MAG: diaminopimelate decarboxylase [Polyangiaceae bacterium]
MPASRDPSGHLLLGGASLAAIAGQVGTPAYVYDLDGIAAEARALRAAFQDSPHLVAYAVKANSAGAIVRTLAAEGCGADIVSGAELLVALGCGVPPEKIVYNGVAKTDDELDRAVGAAIGAIQVESVEEIARVEARARAAGRRVRVSIRVNPGVDLEGATHAHIATGHDRAKFGVPRDQVPRAVERIEVSADLTLVGITSHVGSHFTDVGPYVSAAQVLFSLVRTLRDAGRLKSLQYVDTGGGFGVSYADQVVVEPPSAFVTAARAEQRTAGLSDLALYVEPGRCLVAAHGVLLARVVQTKETSAGRWLMIDAGMNDLIRPALYQAVHRVMPVEDSSSPGSALPWRVVGPVCESSDDFGEHVLPREPPRLVALLDAGAYGYTMASRYNGRQLPAEVFVRGGAVAGVTKRLPPDEWARDRIAAGR